MKKTAKKLMSIMLVLALAFSVSVVEKTSVRADDDNAGTVTFTVEKFSIGQGYLVEPTQVTISDGENGASVFERVMEEKGITYTIDSSWDWYLESIDNADTGVIDIPDEIANMNAVEAWGVQYTPPTNESNTGNDLENNALGEGSYSDMSGWMFTINGKGVDSPMDPVEDGDVIRIQFSIYGWGADIGLEDWNGFGTPDIADKTMLTKQAGSVNNDLMLSDSGIKLAYDFAIEQLTTFASSQKMVDTAYGLLENAVANFSEDKSANEDASADTGVSANDENAQDAVVSSTQETKDADTGDIYPSVKKAVIKKVSAAKNHKAKISVKKISGVSGYEYKYATNKKLKNAVTKTSAKTSVKTESLGNKKKCYVRVRAYKKIKNTNVVAYGKWSAKKSTKLK